MTTTAHTAPDPPPDPVVDGGDCWMLTSAICPPERLNVLREGNATARSRWGQSAAGALGTGKKMRALAGLARWQGQTRRAAVLTCLLGACVRAPAPVPNPKADGPAAELVAQASGTTALLQAVSAVDHRVVWASGRAGTYTRTLDGGERWEAGRVPGADSLEFRDVEAVSADTAYLLSAGTGELSRIYKTVDGGRTWMLQHANREPEAFFDCFDFWTSERGIAFSDAVRGEHLLLATVDGGKTWEQIPVSRLPSALPGEGSFASSGTCVTASGSGRALIGLGNTTATRVLRTDDGGRTWAVAATPVVSGTGAGIGSVVAFDSITAVALGGDFGNPASGGERVAITSDGGRTWTAGGVPTFAGAVYGAARVPGASGQLVVAVGPGGADLSRDGGRTWARLDTAAYWSVDIASAQAGWLVGPGGRIVRLRLR